MHLEAYIRARRGNVRARLGRRHVSLIAHIRGERVHDVEQGVEVCVIMHGCLIRQSAAVDVLVNTSMRLSRGVVTVIVAF